MKRFFTYFNAIKDFNFGKCDKNDTIKMRIFLLDKRGIKGIRSKYEKSF
jgi:hypothetical protein